MFRWIRARWRMPRDIREIKGIVMGTQDQVQELVGQVDSIRVAVETGVAGIRSDLEAALAAHPEVDLTALSASVANLQSAVQSVTDLDGENPVAPVPAPATPEVDPATGLPVGEAPPVAPGQ